MGRPTGLPAPPRTPGATQTWRRAAACSTKNQFRILKTHCSAPAQILSDNNGLARSTLSDIFRASTQDYLSNFVDESGRLLFFALDASEIVDDRASVLRHSRRRSHRSTKARCS